MNENFILQLSAMFARRDGRNGEFSNQALAEWIEPHMTSFLTNQIVQFLYSPLEIIIILFIDSVFTPLGKLNSGKLAPKRKSSCECSSSVKEYLVINDGTSCKMDVFTVQLYFIGYELRHYLVPSMDHSLYETRLPGIMVAVFIKTNIQSKMMNTTTLIPCSLIKGFLS